MCFCCLDSHTPPKLNMEPENDSFQKESPFPEANFRVSCYAILMCHGNQKGPRAAQVCINYTQISSIKLASRTLHHTLKQTILAAVRKVERNCTKMNAFLVAAPGFL